MKEGSAAAGPDGPLLRRAPDPRAGSQAPLPSQAADVTACSPDTFALLFEQHRPMLLRRCARRLADPGLAEDVVQDTFVRAAAHVARSGLPHRLGPWLATIALNRAIDVARRRGFEVPTGAPEEPAGDAQAANAADPTFHATWSAEAPRRIREALADLPARERRAILRGIAGASYASIAAAEGMTLAAVKSVLYRARTRFRELAQSQDIIGVLGAPMEVVRRAYGDVSIGLRSLRPSERILSAVAAGFVSVATIISFVVPPPIVDAAPDPPENRRSSEEAVPADVIPLGHERLVEHVGERVPTKLPDLPDLLSGPKLELTGRVNRTKVRRGESITYTWTLRNVGTAPALDIALITQPPAHTSLGWECGEELTIEPFESSDGYCTDPLWMAAGIVAPPQLTMSIMEIKPGETKRRQLTFVVGRTAEPDSILIDTTTAEAVNHAPVGPVVLLVEVTE